MPQRQLSLYVRSLAPEGTGFEQRAVLENLERLEEQNVIDDYEIEVWGERLATDGPVVETAAGRSLHDRLDEFRTWSEEEGVSVDRFFPVREIDSEITGTSQRVISLPVMALAEYEDGELEHFTPNESGNTVETVRERLATLTTPTPEPDRSDAVPALD